MYNEDYIWNVVYNVDGMGLADYLNDFYNTDKYESSFHGEYTYTEEGFKFSQWSKWQDKVSYYFAVFFDIINDNENNFEEQNIIDCLVFIVCRSLGLVDYAENIPKNCEFLFGQSLFLDKE